MALTRSPSRLLLKEFVTPGAAPADSLWLFARDDGTGVTKLSYRGPDGIVVDVAQPAGGGTSNPDAEFYNAVREGNCVGDGVTNDAPNLQAALNNAPTGAIVYLPRGAYKLNTQVNVPGGKHLMGTRMVNENTYTAPNDCRIFAGAGGIANLVNIATGGSISNLTVDALGNAQVAVMSGGSAIGVSHMNILGGTQYTFRAADNTQRHRWDHVHCNGNGFPSQAVMQIWSTDHLVDSIWAEGGGAGSATFKVEGNTGMFSNMHLFAGPAQTSALILAETGNGSQNMFSACYFYGGGAGGDGVISVRGAGNQFGACGAGGAATGKPSIGIRAKPGNQFWGWYYADDTMTATLIAKFLTGAGAASSSKSAVGGTRIYWSSDNVSQVSSRFTNLTDPTSGDGIDLVGYASGVSGGSTGAETYRT